MAHVVHYDNIVGMYNVQTYIILCMCVCGATEFQPTVAAMSNEIK